MAKTVNCSRRVEIIKNVLAVMLISSQKTDTLRLLNKSTPFTESFDSAKLPIIPEPTCT